MLVHVVAFWLVENLSDEQKADFRRGVESLGQIEDVKALYVGTPAATPPRPVIEGGYDFLLTVVLDDVAAHDRYQEHKLHQQFLADYKQWFKKVLVYDAG